MAQEAKLHGGPADGQNIVLRGERPGRWPEYICAQPYRRHGLAIHYRHIAAGVYEYQGACVEFDHTDRVGRRCPDCGAEIVTGEG